MSKIKCKSAGNEVFEESRKSTNPYQRPDILYHFPLYIISLITALATPICLKKYRPKPSFWYKCYCVLSIIAIIIITIYSAIGRQRTAYKFLIQTVKITDVIQQSLLLISNVYAIFNVLCWGSSKYNLYFEKLKHIDEHLCTTANIRKKKICYFFRLTLIHIAMIFVCIYDYFAWTHAMGDDIYQHYSFRLYTYYLNVVIVLQIMAFSSSIQTRFEILNERLLDSFYNWSEDSKEEVMLLCDDFKNLNSFCPKYLTLKCITKMHDILCDIVDLLNKVYGFNIVLLVANIIVNCVMALNVTLIFGTGVQPANKNQDTSSGNIVLLNVAWAALFLVSYNVLCFSFRETRM